MPSAEQFRLATGAGLLLVWVGFVALQVRYGNVSTVEYAVVGLATLFLLALLIPGVSDRPGFPAVSLGVCALLAGASAVRNGSILDGAFAAVLAVGAVVELYNWRTGSALLRLD